MNYKRIIETYLETTEKEDPETVRDVLKEKPLSQIFINQRNYKNISSLFVRDMQHNNRSERT